MEHYLYSTSHCSPQSISWASYAGSNGTWRWSKARTGPGLPMTWCRQAAARLHTRQAPPTAFWPRCWPPPPSVYFFLRPPRRSMDEAQHPLPWMFRRQLPDWLDVFCQRYEGLSTIEKLEDLSSICNTEYRWNKTEKTIPFEGDIFIAVFLGVLCECKKHRLVYADCDSRFSVLVGQTRVISCRKAENWGRHWKKWSINTYTFIFGLRRAASSGSAYLHVRWYALWLFYTFTLCCKVLIILQKLMFDSSRLASQCSNVALSISRVETGFWSRAAPSGWRPQGIILRCETLIDSLILAPYG